MIPNEAVEAALKAADPDNRGWVDERDIRSALEAALPHLLDREKVAAILGDIDGGLELLRLAIAAQDPKEEVLFRVKDLVADVEHLRTLAHPTKGGEA